MKPGADQPAATLKEAVVGSESGGTYRRISRRLLDRWEATYSPGGFQLVEVPEAEIRPI